MKGHRRPARPRHRLRLRPGRPVGVRLPAVQRRAVVLVDTTPPGSPTSTRSSPPGRRRHPRREAAVSRLANARAVVVCLESDTPTRSTPCRPGRCARRRHRRARPHDRFEDQARARRARTRRRTRSGSAGVGWPFAPLQPGVAEFLDVVMHEDSLDWRVQQVRWSLVRVGLNDSTVGGAASAPACCPRRTSARVGPQANRRRTVVLPAAVLSSCSAPRS